ncbi:MAG: hypothetical protein IJ525_05445 [Alphaproteobacteria bacterium]|nr:hypothetical protein [Alphaproteobacteria bacterium]
MPVVYRTKEPEPIILEGYSRIDGKLKVVHMFFVKYDFNLGYLIKDSGERLRLTPLRMKVVELLIKAVRNDVPYMFGPHLMESAGSKQRKLSRLFYDGPEWRQFITMPIIGYYRLNLYEGTIYGDYLRPRVIKRNGLKVIIPPPKIFIK